DLVTPSAPLAHPLDDGSAVVVERSVAETAAGLGADRGAYEMLLELLVRRAQDVLMQIMGPPRLPVHPLLLARFGLPGILPATCLGRLAFRGPRARALLAGAAAHSVLSLAEAGTGAFGLLMLLSAHAGGWPIARGGSASVTDLLVCRLQKLGGQVRCDHRVSSLDDLPAHRAALLDLVPRGVL